MYRDHYGTAHVNHLCGLYYSVPHLGRLQRSYLPQVEVNVHASILATTSRTQLQQTFQNPSTTRGIREVRYAFPLYDGVSVVAFQCHVGNRLIIGEVKEKENAKKVYKEAVDRGETAGLLEQLPEASDVFTTTIGNIPPGAKVTVEIAYLGELKHDMEVDGIRFTIPTSICPRYGYVSSSAQQLDGSIAITVDAETAEGSFIQRMQSPSHPISMTMGTTSVEPDAAPSMSKASASLSLGVAHLDNDFVLQVLAKDTDIPRAILETHPTIPNQRALMATLVPRFTLPPEKPEVVFVCDQSGSMGGSSMDLAKEALQVFLKSLPVGVKFNICSFGTEYDFLFPRSASYSQDTLATATRHAARLSADYGGTEMLEPLRATIERRYKDMPLNIILLTDGEIWEQQVLFDYLNAQIQETKAPIRVFTLGIGSGVSHSLIEGIAKAGNGFAQCVQSGEKMNSKVVRMLKGALSPHVNDYTLEVKYSSSPDCDFEVVEKVADSLHVALALNESSPETEKVSNPYHSTFQPRHADAPKQPPKIISLFDTTFNSESSSTSPPTDRFSHLPLVPTPKILQAPQSIPPLFSFTRSTIYLLLSPHAPTATPTSVVLRGTSNHGPLELEIPVHDSGTGQTVHQLAAKKAVSELEMGRGWLACARTSEGELLKDKFEGRFSDMVEREAVRLGVQFKVGGKWTSFVATEHTKPKSTASEGEDEVMDEDWEYLEDEKAAEMEAERQRELDARRAEYERQKKESEELQRNRSSCRGGGGRGGDRGGGRGGGRRGGGLFGSASSAFGQNNTLSMLPFVGIFGGGKGLDANNNAAKPATGGLFGGGSTATNIGGGLSGQASTKSATSSLFGSDAPTTSGFGSPSPSNAQALQDYQESLMLLRQENPKRLRMAPAASTPSYSTGGGLLAANNNAAKPATGGLFGGGSTTTNTGGGLFGRGVSTQQPEPNFDLGLNFGDGDAALENFDFDSFLNQGDADPSFDFSDFRVADSAFTPLAAQGPASAQRRSSTKSTLPPHFAVGGSVSARSPSYSPTSPSYAPMAASASASYSPTSPVAESKESDSDSDEGTGFGLFDNGIEMEGSARPARRRKRVKRNMFIDVEAEVDEEEEAAFDSTVSDSGVMDEVHPNDLLEHSAPPPPPYSPTPPIYSPASPLAPTQTHSPQEILRLLIAHQSFSGEFPYHAKVLEWLSISIPDFSTAQQDLTVSNSTSDLEKSGTLLTTALVIVYMEKKLASDKEEWELVVEKARSWLEGQWDADGGEACWEAAARMV